MRRVKTRGGLSRSLGYRPGYASHQSGKRLLATLWLSATFVSRSLTEHLYQVMSAWEHGTEWVLAEAVLFSKDGTNGEGLAKESKS